MNALDMVVQALEFGAELVGSARRHARDFSEVARDQAGDFADVARKHSGKFSSAARERAADYGDQAAEFTKNSRKRTREFGEAASDRVRHFAESARETVRDFGDEAPKKAKRIRKKIEEQFEPEPSVGARILPFVAGLSVGFGAALLLAPRSGRETRARLTRRAQEIEFPRTAGAR